MGSAAAAVVAGARLWSCLAVWLCPDRPYQSAPSPYALVAAAAAAATIINIYSS